MRPALSLVLALAAAGCGFGPQSSSAKLTENAYEMNVAARFGRMDVAIEFLHPEAVAKYTASHAEWGKRVRVVDLDFAGMRIVKHGEARVDVQVMWQRIDGLELRTTNLTQTWKEKDGRWLVAKEETTGGDGGLLIDPPDPKKDPKKGVRMDVDGAPNPIGDAAKAPSLPKEMEEGPNPACALQPDACK
jgi:hypothetical protein